jgi:hypothetical protein
LVRNISISGAALDVASRYDIPEHFDMVFKVDGTHIPCHVVWRHDEQIGVAFDPPCAWSWLQLATATAN